MNFQIHSGQDSFISNAYLRLLIAMLWLVGFCGTGQRALGAPEFKEYDVKAEYLARFAQFVKWPAASGSSIIIGILGEDPFEGALDKLIKVKRARRVEDLKGCQIIFIGKSERANIGSILAGLAGTSVLTVGESDGFTKQGGIIGFTMDGSKVRFEINTGAAGRAGLKISSQLLKVATPVNNQ